MTNVVEENPNIVELSPEESLAAEKQAFQELASSPHITRGTLMEGWDIYTGYTAIRKDIERTKPDYSPICSAELTAVLAEIRSEVLKGNFDGLKKKDIRTARVLFMGDTIGLRKMGGELGVLLRDLEGDALENAEIFCDVMNKVGLKKGDIEVLEN